MITEFTDVHWESNGLLDMCRNPKAYFDVIGQVNSPDAIVPTDWERIAFWEGERCEVKLALSHFSSADLAELRLWSGSWISGPRSGASFEGITPQRAQLTNVGTVVFDVPRLEQAIRARLEMRLINAAGELVTRNHHELYFFPRAESRERHVRLAVPGLPRLAARLAGMGYELTDQESADLVVVERMTDELRWYVQNGGRVLWLAEEPDSQQTHLGPISIAQRQGRSWQGDWASSMSWIRQDKIFQGIPTGGTVDFAFADLTPETVIVGLTPRDFAANVHSGLFVGWVHHLVALVAERPIDRGRVMICTYRLREHLGSHPVATLMMRDMIERIAKRPEAEEPAGGGGSPRQHRRRRMPSRRRRRSLDRSTAEALLHLAELVRVVGAEHPLQPVPSASRLRSQSPLLCQWSGSSQSGPVDDRVETEALHRHSHLPSLCAPPPPPRAAIGPALRRSGWSRDTIIGRSY